MEEPNSGPPDRPSDRLGDSVTDIARGLLGAVGDEDTVEEFDRALDDLTGNASPAQVGATASTAIFAGLELAEARRRMRDRATASQPADDPAAAGPLIHCREIRDDGDLVGMRVLVDYEPQAIGIMRDGKYVKIQTPTGVEREFVGFPIDHIEQLDSEFAEYIVHARGRDDSADDQGDDDVDTTSADDDTDTDTTAPEPEEEGEGDA